MSSTPLEVTGPNRAGLTGTPVLLIHGFTSDAATDWAGWVDALAERGRPAYLVDLPAHGSAGSPGSAEEVTTSRIVEALSRAIASTGADSIDVIGYSLGARLAWELPRHATTPIGHLVLGGISPGEPFAMVDFAQLHAFAAGGAQPTDPFTAMMSGMISRPGLDRAGLARVADGLAREPFAPDATNAPRIPVLFAAGADDGMSAGIDALVSLVPGAQFIQVPGDHLGALASPELREAALRFIG